MFRRPNTVIMVAFATGSVTVQANYQPAEVRALLKVGPDEEVTLKSITETKVKEDARTDVVQYILKNEEVNFRRGDVVFWSVAEAFDPPKIDTSLTGLVMAK